MAEEIKVPGILRPGTGDYHSYSKDIIDDQLRNKTQSELNALFNQGKGLDENGNIVPIGGGTSNADDIPYTENIPSSQHTAGSTGKKIKQLEDRIDALVPTEEPTLGETVDLSNYMMDGNVALSFTFDSNKKYVYEGRVTSMCTYARNNTSYAAFKVVDIDKYITYTISGNTFTYYGQLDSETLPNEARSKFELGRYALVKQLQGATGDSWVDGTAGVFVDTDERPMAFKYVVSVEINSQTINNVLLARTSNDSHIYVYRLTSGLFKFYTKVASSNAAFGELNKLIVGSGGGDITGAAVNGSEVPKNGTILQFPTYPTSGTMSYSDSTNYDAGSIGKAIKDAKIATNIAFNDSATHLGVNNVQGAIDILAANIHDHLTILNITLVYANGTVIVNKNIDINISFRGTSHSTSGTYTTNSSGTVSLSIPYGSVYSITYNDIADYQTPESISGSADNYIININGIYQVVSNTEKVIVTCSIRNGNSTPNGKKAYIDIYDSTGSTLITEKAFTITLNSQGLASIIKDSNNQVVDNCEVPNGNVYKVYGQDWDDSENPPYSVSGIQSFLASKQSRIVHFDYTYLNVGLFLIIKNDLNLTDGYDSFKIKDINANDNSIRIIDNDNEYWIYYDNGVGIKRYLANSSSENSHLWIEDNNINTKVLGIGFRNQTLNVASNSNNAISGTCAFCMLFSSSTIMAYAMWETNANVTVTSEIDGLYTTEFYKDTEHPTFAIALPYANLITQIGIRQQQAFIMAANQFAVLYNNFNTVKIICEAVNCKFNFMDSNDNYWCSTCNNVGNNGAVNSMGKAYSFDNTTKMLVNEPIGTSGKHFTYNAYKTFPVYSY